MPSNAPLLIAGDFNDWRNHADDLLAERLGLAEVFAGDGRRPSRSYPAALPMFRLDRISTSAASSQRGARPCRAALALHFHHAALSAELPPAPRRAC